MTDQTIEQIKAELDRADADLKAIIRERDEAVRAAKAKVQDEFRDRTDEASRRMFGASQTLRDHISATATHPWEGKRVYRMERPFSSHYSSVRPKPVRVEGVVEVRRIGTELPANVSFGLPSLGSAFVRLCKANGEVGKRIYRDGPDAKYRPLGADKAIPVWKLVEEGEEA